MLCKVQSRPPNLALHGWPVPVANRVLRTGTGGSRRGLAPAGTMAGGSFTCHMAPLGEVGLHKLFRALLQQGNASERAREGRVSYYATSLINSSDAAQPA